MPGEGKLIGGGMLGVVVPIAVEFVAQGARVPGVPVKISGVAGVVIGAVPLVGYAAKMGFIRNMKDENKAFALAFGASCFTTGLAIILLDEVRKISGYQFQNVPLGREEYTSPAGQVIKQI